MIPRFHIAPHNLATKLLILLIGCIASPSLTAQHKVQFIVTDLSYIKQDSIFIVGTFSQWNPSPGPRYQLKDSGPGEKSIVLTLPAGWHEYKYNGGNWNKVEKNSFGSEIPNHRIHVTKDTIIRDKVFAWRNLVISSNQLALEHAVDDTTKMPLLATLFSVYAYESDRPNTDTALFYLRQSLSILEKIKSSPDARQWARYVDWVFTAQDQQAGYMQTYGNYVKALELRLDNLRMAESTGEKPFIGYAIVNVIQTYLAGQDVENAMIYVNRLKPLLPYVEHDHYVIQTAYICITQAHVRLGQVDSAKVYASKIYSIGLETKRNDPTTDVNYALTTGATLLGNVFLKMNLPDSALLYYRISLFNSNDFTLQSIINSQKGLALLYQQKGMVDSAIFYAKSALFNIQNAPVHEQWSIGGTATFENELLPLISTLYHQQHNFDSAYTYLRLSNELRDSLYNTDKVKQLQFLSFNETLRQKSAEREKQESIQRYKTNLKLYVLLAGLLGLLIVAYILNRNNKQKHKANKALQQTLSDLKSTQAQLVHAEKMASLGELTAGIAHEIQNPLNFVNNFSEVNSELVDELLGELAIGNGQSAKEIAGNIKENEEKIVFHGKRADAIVKSMLQHSRTSSGQKELTDINALVDEYVRLAYHGMRAKDKSFNADLQTNFDPAVGKLNVVGQDIGRVVLNIITNAFYAVSQKSKAGVEAYKPGVSVSTIKTGTQIKIQVRDNGPGIPEDQLDKIFQPFFTTKPTGQGTGLGLSLSYDIMKAHGGTMEVDTREGEGTTFSIILPVI